jgi:hypothetical protein
MVLPILGRGRISTFLIIEGFCIAIMLQMKLEGKSFKMMYNVR